MDKGLICHSLIHLMSLNTFSPRATFLNPANLPKLSGQSSVAVVGAGAFGGWAALNLLRRGLNVTLIDAWGPGNSRSSSGDETRVIRSTYGDNEFYFDLNVRALELWKESEKKWDKKIFYNSGVLWLCYSEKNPVIDASIPFAEKHNMEYSYLDVAALRKRFPRINANDLHHAYFDPFGGYLKARESCQLVAETFVKEGGKYLQALVKPGTIKSSNLDGLLASDGSTVTADAYVFACGSWMGQVFPDALKDTITCTRQEVYYFGVPPDQSETYDSMPVWVDVDGSDFYYGIPGNAQRGFKIGVDRRGSKFDPTTGDRMPDENVLAHARKFIAHRFPGLANAPLIESRVCPYENSPDGNFVFETHPQAGNVVFLGGGSGHGFKHGPALGEWVASRLIQ
jgi:glycine/D-amino acid oxidase-like deaminating enzyme